MENVLFKLEVFEGPLDLLLHLISKNKLNIEDIEIAKITEQYFIYIKEWQKANINFSSEFLVMAAQLLYIKSKTLLPKHDDEDEIDPKLSLEERLIEYQKYKEMARIFGDEQYNSKLLFFHEGEQIKFLEPRIDESFSMPLDKLLEAFMVIIERNEEKKPPQREEFDKVIGQKPVSVFSQAKALVRALKNNKELYFKDIFKGMKRKDEKVAMFLAVLEMLKSNRIYITNKGDEILLFRGALNEQAGD